MRQKTISKEISISGIGIHSGLKSQITICPAEVDSGINFQRIKVKRTKL